MIAGTVRCSDPECNAPLFWGKCPICGTEGWCHDFGICPVCGYNGADFITLEESK